MTADKEPTEEQLLKLKRCIDKREETIKFLQNYHGKRVEFFKQWNFNLNIINAFYGVGALFVIGWNLAEKNYSIASIKISLFFAAFAVLLLFFTMLVDFAKKEEKHNWLVKSYMKINQKLSDIYLVNFNKLTTKEYEKFIKLFDDIKEEMTILKIEEPPILQFEYFLSSMKKNVVNKKETLIIMKVPRWQFWLANYFSMTNALARFIAIHNYEEQQKEKRKKEQQQESK